MEKRIKKTFFLVFFSAIIILKCPAMISRTYASPDEMTYAADTDNETNIAVDPTNFPDNAFRNYVMDKIDTDRNRVLSATEISRCTSIICSYSNIYDLTGIELFYNLEILDCSFNSLTNLNVSSNISLKELDCSVNNLNSLDVSKNPFLTVLDCSENNLSSLNVNNNTVLTKLACNENKLSTLDVSKNNMLTILACYYNNLRNLILDTNTALTELYCRNNDLSSLDLRNNNALIELDCSQNNISYLVLGKKLALRNVTCSYNCIYGLDISGCSNLSYFDCSSNDLLSLIIGNHAALTFFDCGNNDLSSLDVSKCTALQSFSCYNNRLTNLDLSKNTALIVLDCSRNNLNSLDVSINTTLEYLHCFGNNLNSLNIGKNAVLKFLDCSNNNLNNLDVSKCTNLYSLYCYANKINNIDTVNLKILDRIILLNTPTVDNPTMVSSGVHISWSKSIGATGYYIYRREVGDSWQKLAEVEGVDTLSYVDSTTSKNKVYEYTIRGYWENFGDIYLSDYDHNGKRITLGTTTLTTPKLSSVENVNGGVKVTWGKVEGAAKYRVYYKTGSGSWTKIVDTTSTSYTWKKAKSGTKYRFTVRCISSDGKSFTSSYDSTGKSLTYVAAPVISSISNTASGMKISWGKVEGAAKYRVYYKTGSGKWTKIADTTSTNYTWKKAKSGTKYRFTVRCISSNAKSFTSSYDNTGKGKTYIAAPKITSVSNVKDGVKISWGKVTGAAKYRVYYKTGSGGWKKVVDTSSTSYTWKGTKKGTTYTFTVRCISSDGKSFTSSYDSNGKKITYTGK